MVKQWNCYQRKWNFLPFPASPPAQIKLVPSSTKFAPSLVALSWFWQLFVSTKGTSTSFKIAWKAPLFEKSFLPQPIITWKISTQSEIISRQMKISFWLRKEISWNCRKLVNHRRNYLQRSILFLQQVSLTANKLFRLLASDRAALKSLNGESQYCFLGLLTWIADEWKYGKRQTPALQVARYLLMRPIHRNELSIVARLFWQIKWKSRLRLSLWLKNLFNQKTYLRGRNRWSPNDIILLFVKLQLWIEDVKMRYNVWRLLWTVQEADSLYLARFLLSLYLYWFVISITKSLRRFNFDRI